MIRDKHILLHCPPLSPTKTAIVTNRNLMKQETSRALGNLDDIYQESLILLNNLLMAGLKRPLSSSCLSYLNVTEGFLPRQILISHNAVKLASIKYYIRRA